MDLQNLRGGFREGKMNAQKLRRSFREWKMNPQNLRRSFREREMGSQIARSDSSGRRSAATAVGILRRLLPRRARDEGQVFRGPAVSVEDVNLVIRVVVE